MDNKFVNIKQTLKLLKCDLPQLQQAIEHLEIPLWAYIGNKTRELDKQLIRVVELKYIQPKSSCENIHTNSLPSAHETNIPTDGFVELDTEDLLSTKNKDELCKLRSLFSGANVYFSAIKSTKPEHIHTLKPGCYLNLEDIYTRKDDEKKLTPYFKSTQSRNTKGFRNDIIAQAVIEKILPQILPNKQPHINQKEIRNLTRECFKELKSTLENMEVVIVDSNLKASDMDDWYIIYELKNQKNKTKYYNSFKKACPTYIRHYLAN